STYASAIRSMAADLGLSNDVKLTGPLPQPAVAAHFRTADAFVVLSEHEGFLVPLLEAWWHRLPIVAFAAAAVPETLRHGGGVPRPALGRSPRPPCSEAAGHGGSPPPPQAPCHYRRCRASNPERSRGRRRSGRAGDPPSRAVQPPACAGRDGGRPAAVAVT